MALQSELFRGDPKLEAAAVSDSAHIRLGAVGPHVGKIQEALIRLDGAAISVDMIYGSATAAAVLAFKQKRKIINYSYQRQADNIVGKMTVAALDREMSDYEKPKGPIELRVLSPAPLRLDHRPHVVANPSRAPMLAFSLSPALFGPPSFSPGPIVSINKGQTALVEVRNGRGAQIMSGDPKIASIRDPVSRGELNVITSDPQTVEIVGNHRGGTVIAVTRVPPFVAPPGMPGISVPPAPRPKHRTSLTVSVKETRPTNYVETMKPHNHQPTGQWSKILSVIDQPTDSVSGKALKALCVAGAEPIVFVNAAIAGEFGDKPTALKHLRWYLGDGRGQEFNEDENIRKWVRADDGIRRKVVHAISKDASRRNKGFFLYHWRDYGADARAQDYYYSFGTIDRVDWEVDWATKTIKIWFKDIYEWHPVCPGFYDRQPDDDVRPTNSLHAALVELKKSGAADFWMVGEATLPMSEFGFP